MKTFKQILNEETISPEEWRKRTQENIEVFKDISKAFNPMEGLILTIRNIACGGNPGKIKEDVRELQQCCKKLIEASKKLQEKQ